MRIPLLVAAVFQGMLLMPLAFAQVQLQEPLHMTLLAVEEVNGSLTGNTADLFLEVRPGKGRVFLETSPLTKIDTQISTRFAKEIACNYFDLRCGQQDFIYTIRSDSTIIGGPSAGSALAALTTAGLLGLSVNESVAVTGTINSGGMIGPVGGLQAKIEAAKRAGIAKVLIPFGTRTDGNGSIDLVEHGKNLSIEVVEVRDLNEVVAQVSGKRLLEDGASVTVQQDYLTIMSGISRELCARSRELQKQLNSSALTREQRQELLNQTTRAHDAQLAGSHYAAASYCFGLNIRLRSLISEQQNITEAKIKSKVEQLRQDIARLEQDTRSRELGTIADLQTFTIVIERLSDAKLFLERVEKEDNKGFLLAFAEERVFSAVVWSRFFTMQGMLYELDEAVLQDSCIAKVQEAKERLEYLKLFLEQGLENIQESIARAEAQGAAQEHALCLIQASQAKADANAILSTFGVISDEQLDALVANKLHALEALIARTIEKRAFPILGYSYYEYATSLQEEQASSALLYAEYALELSNLDIYFTEEAEAAREQPAELPFPAAFLLGFAAAVLVFLLLQKEREG